MIFARFVGPVKSEEALTEGRLYVSRPEVDEPGTVGFDYIEVTGDNGESIRENPDDERFEYLEEVYAVVANPFDEFVAGEVVVVDGAPDIEYLHVQGIGNRKASDLILLDRTNLYPGVLVGDGTTGRWLKVKKVDECLWVTAGVNGPYRSPCEFRFAVSDGSLVEPLTKCVDEEGEPGLTKGHFYPLVSSSDDLVTVVNDDGAESSYMASRFSMDF
jgi:hypothetical protein